MLGGRQCGERRLLERNGGQRRDEADVATGVGGRGLADDLAVELDLDLPALLDDCDRVGAARADVGAADVTMSTGRLAHKTVHQSYTDLFKSEYKTCSVDNPFC